jgi:preprotein translocase subunit SecA
VAGFKSLIGTIFDANEREIRRLMPTVEKINALEESCQGLSDEALRAKTAEFLARLASGEPLDSLLSEAFAAVREAARRTIGLRHYDVQLIGGVLLHQGKIVEMKTGEGKTLVATLPLYLNALLGRGAHLVTPNDYLSKLGAQWMGPVYHALGISLGVIQSSHAEAAGGSFLYDPGFLSDDDRYQSLRPCTRQEAYRADITYGTNHEFGFDYLRDNMVIDLAQCVQRELYYAIVDEIDNILIDEARTPLIISGPSDEASSYYQQFARLVRHLQPSSEASVEQDEPDGDYVYELRTRNVFLTERGIEKMQAALGIDNLYAPEHAEMLPYLDNALRAHVVFHLDRDYVVQNGEIIIVDDFTGRLMYGRRYSEGLHQAIEAKEGVTVQRENLTHATITYQNFFRMYEKLAGMTGTAATEGEEFEEIYKLEVTILPTNVEYRARVGELETIKDRRDGAEVITYESPDSDEFYYKRVDYPDAIYGTEALKFAKAIDEIAELHAKGRPVLVGTAAIETSEHISHLLDRRGIPHQVLNAKHHEREALIIAQAGRPGAVTIATNMAGRGVDILLGGNVEGMAREKLRKQGVAVTEATPEQWEQALAEARAECAADRQRVWEQGGLHVLGTERHEARRIDNQLRGRAGRQGDPGSSRFYLSLEDDLFRRFGGDRLKGFLQSNMGDLPIELGLVSKSIEQSQERVEGYNFDIRKRVLEYDEVINEQRRVIYEQRRRVLELDDLRDILLEMADREIKSVVTSHTQGFHEDWDVEALAQSIRTFLPVDNETVAEWPDRTAAEIIEGLQEHAEHVYEENRRQIGADIMRLLRNETRRLDQLAAAESPPGLLSMLQEGLRERLPGSIWTQLELAPVANLDRADRDHVEQVIGEFMTHRRDRSILLRTVDMLWIRHLTDLDILREGIGLRAVAQMDPLVAYKKEAHDMYGALLAQIEHDVVLQTFRPITVRVAAAPQPRRQLFTNRGADAEPAQRTVRKSKDSVGRNDPCPCGSGKKYKQCCMRKDSAQRSPAAVGPSQSGRPVRKRKKRR